MDEKWELRVILEENFKEKIEKLKEHYGIKNTTELIRFLIMDKYRDITQPKI